MFKRVFRSRSRITSDNEASAGAFSELERQYGGPIITDSNSSMGSVNNGRPKEQSTKKRPDLPFGQIDPGFAYLAYTPPEGQELVKVWIDHRSLTLFELPGEHLKQHSLEFRRALAEPPELNPKIFSRAMDGHLAIQNFSVGHFFDFAQWISRHGEQMGEYKLLEHYHRNVPYAIGAQIARLIADLIVGLTFQSNSFQNAVIQDLYVVMPAHMKPEYIIGRLFEATASWSLPPSQLPSIATIRQPTRLQQYQAAHPARRLLLEICAAKIGRGPYKRPLIESIVDDCGDEVAKEFHLLFDLCSWQIRPGEGLKPVESFLLGD